MIVVFGRKMYIDGRDKNIEVKMQLFGNSEQLVMMEKID